MAGLGFKDFQVGEVLTSSDVDGYLMQQTVMRFADSAARGSALGTAAGTGVALAEGMVSYLDSANRIEVFDGTSWRLPGRVIQVVTGSTTSTTSNTTDTPAATALQVDITPTSASSTILVFAQARQIRTTTSGNSGVSWTLFEDSVSTGAGVNGNASSGDAYDSPGALVYESSPATTSSVNYRMYINKFNDSVTANSVSGQQTMVAMEVAV